jgi:hypothetical protein
MMSCKRFIWEDIPDWKIYTFFQISPHLDEKIWFGQRPDSGPGRVTAPRLTNWAGISYHRVGGKAMFPENVEHYPKPMEQLWGFEGSKERGSFGVNSSVPYVCLISWTLSKYKQNQTSHFLVDSYFLGQWLQIDHNIAPFQASEFPRIFLYICAYIQSFCIS